MSNSHPDQKGMIAKQRVIRQSTMAETDHRFPTGPWVGFWIQKGIGKQQMRCRLAFCAGKVSGGGSDLVGPFTMSGWYDTTNGRCELVKQYEGAHSLEYKGACEDDVMWFWGVWHLGGHQGGFHIWPDSAPDPTQRRLKIGKDFPAECSNAESHVLLFV